MVLDPTGPNKLRPPKRKPPARKRLDPPLVHEYATVAGLLFLKPGRRVDLKTARGTPFFAMVSPDMLCWQTGLAVIQCSWDTLIWPDDWGFNRTKRQNAYVATYCRALDDYTRIYYGIPPGRNGDGAP